MSQAGRWMPSAVGQARPHENALELAELVYGGLVLDRLVRHAVTVTGADGGAVLVRQPASDGVMAVAAVHGANPDLVGERLSITHGAAGAALRSGKPTVIPDHGRVASRFPHPLCNGARAEASAPAYAGGRIAGALSVGSHGARLGFGPVELEVLTGLADLLGVTLDQIDHRDELAGTAEGAATELVDALATWDDQTAEHSAEVLEIARRAGMQLGLDEADLLELELAAHLHDVGKIRVPLETLRKPGRLDEHELAVMRQHPVWGAEMIARIPGLAAVAAIVRFHHERYDGRGYPGALRGRRIPLASRIVTACDAYGAMTADRPYRRSLGRPRALRELRRGAGTQFDPDVVEAMAGAV
jgi:HD-GYP domain-containing protein (c-di-GMP phosphodiesterase class II)